MSSFFTSPTPGNEQHLLVLSNPVLTEILLAHIKVIDEIYQSFEDTLLTEILLAQFYVVDDIDQSFKGTLLISQSGRREEFLLWNQIDTSSKWAKWLEDNSATFSRYTENLLRLWYKDARSNPDKPLEELLLDNLWLRDEGYPAIQAFFWKKLSYDKPPMARDLCHHKSAMSHRKPLLNTWGSFSGVLMASMGLILGCSLSPEGFILLDTKFKEVFKDYRGA